MFIIVFILCYCSDFLLLFFFPFSFFFFFFFLHPMAWGILEHQILRPDLWDQKSGLSPWWKC